jgi:hypothetical protein
MQTGSTYLVEFSTDDVDLGRDGAQVIVRLPIGDIAGTDNLTDFAGHLDDQLAFGGTYGEDRTRSFLNLAGRSCVRVGMWRSPMTRTRTMTRPLLSSLLCSRRDEYLERL